MWAVRKTISPSESKFRGIAGLCFVDPTDKYLPVGILISLGDTRMSDKNFRITFTRGTSSSVITTSVRASSASQAKEKIKERERGQAKIISAVEI